MEDMEYQAGKSTCLYHNAFLFALFAFISWCLVMDKAYSRSECDICHSLICLSFLALYFIFEQGICDCDCEVFNAYFPSER